MERESVTKDEYQESHLASPFGGWSRSSYRFLALITGILAALLYENRKSIITLPLLGWEGYLFFQIMTAGVCIFSLYGAFYNRKSPSSLGSTASFTWWGFWLRDLFMALVFFPFAVVVIRVLLSGAGSGLFIDLGGWDALFHPDTPTGELIPLFLIGMLLVIIMLGLLYVPTLLFYRSLRSLLVQLKHGTSRLVFDQANYAPGEYLNVKITSRLSNRTPNANRRVFLNYIEDFAAVPPTSSKNYKRTYLHTEFQDVTLAELESGISFHLPAELHKAERTYIPTGPNGVNYWEVLVEEPEGLYWARFLFAVK